MVDVPLWMFPLVFTIFAFVVADRVSRGERTGDYGFPVMGFVCGTAAIILSLAAWLVWAVIR